jgi:hypothetical protein
MGDSPKRQQHSTDYLYLNSPLQCRGVWIAWRNEIMTWKNKKMKNITSNAKPGFFRHFQGKSTEYTID